MKLYLVQHGEAKTEEEDPTRPLTIRGRTEVEKVARAAKTLGVKPAVIFHSGKLRAEQTSEIIADVLQLPQKPKTASGLNPNDDVRGWISTVLESKEDLMLVGHLPFMDKLTSILLCGNENANVVVFRYGAMVCLERRGKGNWSLVWILAPDLVQA